MFVVIRSRMTSTVQWSGRKCLSTDSLHLGRGTTFAVAVLVLELKSMIKDLIVLLNTLPARTGDNQLLGCRIWSGEQELRWQYHGTSHCTD